MAIDWGTTEKNLRVGIDREILSITATGVSVRFHFWVGGDPEAYGWNDDMTLKITGSGGGHTVNFHKSTGNQKVYSRTLSASRSLSGGPTWSVTGTISGAFNGATPSQSDSYTVPAKSVQPPNPPWGPGIDVNRGSTTAGISWGLSTDNNGAAVEQWRIQVGRNSSFSNLEHDAFTSAGVRNDFVSGLTRATDYYIRVKGRNSAGWGDWSSTKPFTTLPTVPGVVAGRSVGSITSTGATLSWNAPSDTGGRTVEGYLVSWRTASGGAWTEAFQSGTSRVLTGLEPATQYEFKVQARNSVGDGPLQDTGQPWTTSTSLPSAPGRPGVAPSTTSCAVFWATPASNGSTITGYQIQYSTTSTFGSPTTVDVGLVTSHTLTGLSSDTGYYVRVRAKTSGSPGAWSPAKSFSTAVDPTPYPVIRIWDGTDWVRLNPINVWDGTDFLEVANVKVWNGTAFVDLLMTPY